MYEQYVDKVIQIRLLHINEVKNAKKKKKYKLYTTLSTECE